MLLASALALVLARAYPGCTGPPVRALPPRAGAIAACQIAAAPRLAVPSREQGATLSPLPELPTLDASEELLVQSGKCLRWQQPPDKGRPVGSGFAVQELRADADEVWRAVSAFGRYPELISTVRTATAYDPPEGTDADEPANICRYSFLVSRIRLVLNVRFAVDEAQRYAAWRLDKPSWVLDDSTGYWRVQPVAGRPGVVRVWFCVSVRLNKLVPRFVVGLVSRLGLAKATRWLRDLETGEAARGEGAGDEAGSGEREGGASPPATAAAVVESGAQQRQSGAPKLGTATSPVAEALASPPRAPPSLAPVTAPPAEAYCTFPSRPRPTPSNLGVRSRDRIIRLAPLTAVEPFDALAQVPSANRAGVWRPLNAPPLSFNAPPISLNAPPLSLNAPPRSRDSPPRSKRRAAAHKSVETDMEVLAITEDV